MADLAGRYGPERVDVVWVEREWSEPGFDLEADARVADDAYVGVWDGRGGKAWLDFCGEPSPGLLAWAEERAREKRLVRALAGGWRDHVGLKALLEASGYELVRNHYRMRIELADVVDEPVWPAGISARPFRPGDERTFYDVHQESFEDHWEHDVADPYDEWAHWLLQPPMFVPELWFLAEEDGEPAGVAICHRRVEAPFRGHVQILGVRRPWRRRGLGLGLLLHAFHAFKREGLTEADLGVDASSLTGATRLYERAGMHVGAVNDTYEKPLT